MTRRALGLDGCRDGWVAVLLVDGSVADVAVLPDVTAARRWAEPHATGIDMPIGLLDGGVREADAAARARLPGRAASVFNAPPRAVVEAHRADPELTYAAANALARRTADRGISQQTWRLVPRIAEVDEAVADDAELLEVHPEVAFAELGGRPLPRKVTWAGQVARRTALADLGLRIPDRFEGDERCAPDDVLDAAVVAWVADGAAAGEALVHLPSPVTQHDRGRPVSIVVRARSGLPRPSRGRGAD
jgi:predicted RNase H-like nuclease